MWVYHICTTGQVVGTQLDFAFFLKVRKQGAQNCLALKEVNLHNPAFGHDKKSRDSNVEKLVSELTIIKEQVRSTMYSQVCKGN